MLGLDAPTKQAQTDPDGNAVRQDFRVIVDAIVDPETRDALDALAQRLEGHASSNGHAVV